MKRTRITASIALVVVGLFLSGILLADKYGVGWGSEAASRLCGAGEESGCDAVNNSAYASFAGLSLAGFGVFFYGSILTLLLLAFASGRRELQRAAGFAALGLVGLALVADVVLFGLQAFAIAAFCRLCLMTYAVNAGILVALLPWRREASSLSKAMGSEQGKPALVSWVVASVLILVSVSFVDRAFSGVEEQRRANLLGDVPGSSRPEAPAREDTPEPETSGEVEAEPPTTDSEDTNAQVARLEQQLSAARDEARRLQGILDDPEKYGEYQTELAAQRFKSAPTENLRLDGVPFKGPAEAPIKVVEYSDFLCPFCRNLASALSRFMTQSGGRIAIYFVNYPLDQDCNPGIGRTIHEGACELALGAVCAQEQDNFWNFHDIIFAGPPENPSAEDVVRLAGSVGLDQDAMRICMGSAKARERLVADIEEAKRLKVNATPTVYINGKKLEQINGFLNVIESESERLGLPSSN